MSTEGTKLMLVGDATSMRKGKLMWKTHSIIPLADIFTDNNGKMYTDLIRNEKRWRLDSLWDNSNHYTRDFQVRDISPRVFGRG